MPIIPLSETLQLQAAQIVYLGVGAGTAIISIEDPVSSYLITSAAGPVALVGNLAIAPAAGTPVNMTRYVFEYSANMTFGGNTLTIFGATMPEQFQNKRCRIIATYDLATTTWDVKFEADFSESDIVVTSNIEDGAITNAKIDPIGGINGSLIQAGTLPDTALASDLGLAKVVTGTLDVGLVLTLNTIPQVVIPAVVGKIIIPLHFNLTILGGAATTVYATNTIIQLMESVSFPQDPMFEFDCLAHPIGSSPNFSVPAFTGNPLLANNSQFQVSQSVRLMVKTGNPTLGDSALGYQIIYYEV